MAELNAQLLEACRADEQRRIDGRDCSIGAAMLMEKDHLMALASEGMDLSHTSFPAVNSMGCVKVLTNAYSVPLKSGTQVQARVSATVVEIWHDGTCVARHQRCYGRQQQVLDLEHYLDVLFRKPGALAGSRPLEQQRKAGLWPASFDQLWESLVSRHGRQNGTRLMISVLKLASQFGRDRLRTAIETALKTGCTDPAAVEHLLRAEDLNRPPCDPVDVGMLAHYHRPMPLMTEYDQLLAAECGQ